MAQDGRRRDVTRSSDGLPVECNLPLRLDLLSMSIQPGKHTAHGLVLYVLVGSRELVSRDGGHKALCPPSHAI